MVLLAGFASLLHRWSGQDRVIIGSPIANRNRAELEGLIGFFVNNLALPSTLERDTSFRDLVDQVRETTLAAYAHQDLPFEHLVEMLEPERDPSREPIFQAAFALQNTPQGSLSLPDLELIPEQAAADFAMVDLLLNATEHDGSLVIALHFDRDLFRRTTILSALARLERILAAAMDRPDVPVADLDLLSDAQRHQLLAEWNDTAAPLDEPLLFHQLFEAQARNHRDAIALLFVDGPEQQRLTYGELDDRANALASWLQAGGVGPETVVAVALRKSVEAIVGFLAILKAGGCYLPLDPDAPAERFSYMVEDSGARAVLSRRADGKDLTLPKGVALLLLEDLQLEVWDSGSALASAESDWRKVRPENAAYSIYTSGSTGQPKGAMLAHRGMVNLARESSADFGIAVGDRVLQMVSLTFDASMFDLALSLGSGATLCLVPKQDCVPGPGLTRLLRDLKITSLTLPPTPLALIPSESLPDLRVLICGGEALPRELVERWAPGRFMVNAYGPTEATVLNSWRRCSVGEGDPPIGRPFSNLRIFVADPSLHLTPVGAVGELLVGGVALSRGYLHRPARTAEFFVPDPFSAESGARLYRSGDLARRLSNGELAFAGRRDDQVKLRGFRIELGEIEAALYNVEGVNRAAVLLRQDQARAKSLVAYLAAEEGVSASDLRQQLQLTLPDYMVPSAFVLRPSLPMSSTGKIDRRALLAEPLAESTSGERTVVEPRTQTEAVVAEIWADLLQRRRIGVDEDFFELGGHSLLAVRVMARIQEAFGVELGIRALVEAPTVAALAQCLDSILGTRAGGVSGERRAPTSFAQQRLWVIDQLDPGGSVYNMAAAVRLQGSLDIEAVFQALEGVVRRHEVLRTTFEVGDELPMQVIHPLKPLKVPVLDLSGLEPPTVDPLLAQHLRNEGEQGFDLSTGPLMRASLLRFADDDYLLAVTMHHIISDGWSVGVFVREFSELYGSLSENQPTDLAPLPLQYADFARWQRKWLQGDVLEDQLAYWRERLEGFEGVLDLPTDRPRPSHAGAEGANYEGRLEEPVVEALEELVRQRGETLFMGLLAGLFVLLHRLTGQPDLAVGTPIAGRNREDIEGLIGFFVNTLVLRGGLEGNLRFSDLLGQARETTLGAYSHQDLPFERVVEAVQPERDLSREPLFQMLFVLQNTPQQSMELPGVTIRPLALESDIAKFDLSLAALEVPDGVVLSLNYRTELFDATTAQRIVGYLKTLLTAAVEEPDALLSQLPMLAPWESQQLLVEWNDTEVSSLPVDTLHGLVAAQASRTPKATAVVWQQDVLSYSELMWKAEELARDLLRVAAIGPEVRVGICLPRTLDLPVAILAVLQAGGAYVPLDPGYPGERLSFLAEDAGLAAIITLESLLDRLPESQVPRVVLDKSETAETSPAAPPEDLLPAASGPGNLAYLIYTSGSTGKPKGVAIEHRSAVEMVRWARTVFSDEELSGVLAATSQNFDLSVWELFVPLAWGGRVLLAENALALSQLPAREEVTLINTVPSAVAELVRQETLPASLIAVNLAGEALPAGLVREILASAEPGQRRVLNLYGPSEDTTYSTWTTVDGLEKPLIGVPLSESRAYVVDGNLRPVALGATGELVLAGQGLARGYLGRPGLTGEKFTPDPFVASGGGAAGARLYRTGDLVRWRRRGELEFLGRRDHQVKVRGFRIELDEINEVLGSLAGVQESVVVVAASPAGESVLVAYVVSPGEDADALKRGLLRQLPEYMVPPRFVFLEALPRTPNGKVDRKALPDSLEMREVVSRAPRTATEELLTIAFGELLGLDAVGIDESFFALGGHSLLATRLATRVRRLFGLDLPLRTIFERPTVAELALAVEHGSGASEAKLAPPLEAISREGRLPLSYAQQRLWFLELLDPGTATYNVPAAVRLVGTLWPEALARSLNEIWNRHEALRATFSSGDGEPRQHIAEAGPSSLPVVDLSGLETTKREAEAGKLAEKEAARPFDLGAGPLARWSLVRLGQLEEGQREHTLQITMHHIVSDGWSVGIFIGELSQLYTAFVDDEPSALVPLPFQYVDFAAWQRSWLTGEVLEEQMAFWRSHLDDLPSALDLPTDRPRPAVQSFRGSSRERVFGPELVEGLDRLQRSEGVTLFMALMAGFAELLARLGGQRQVVVGSPVANRGREETEGLIGFFVNTLGLRTDLSGNPTFGQLLSRIRESTLAAFQHQDVPFDRIVEAVQPERDLSREPIFQVMLIVQNTPEGALELPGLEVRGTEIHGDIAKFDLSLQAIQEGRTLQLSWNFRTDLFDGTTLLRWHGALAQLLEAAVADPNRPVAELPWLSLGESQQLLLEWNDTGLGLDLGNTLHGLVEAQGARTPDAVAVVWQDEALTYSGLLHRSDRLARELRRIAEIGPEVRVGICLPRTLDLPVAILAVLRAGGAYVPLDPAYPQERLSFLVEDSGLAAIVTVENLLDRLPRSETPRVVLPDLWAAEEGSSQESSGSFSDLDAASSSPENLAYLIYTSGSTGKPKGVAIEHRNAVAMVRWARTVFSDEDLSGVLAATSQNFDLSVWELFVPLAWGGRVLLAKDALALADLPARDEVRLINTVPSAMAELVRQKALPERLRTVNLAGEALPAGLVREILDSAEQGARRVLNLYGPSEDTTYSTWAAVEGREKPLIGAPLAESQAYVVDENLRPMALGAPGELVLAGRGLARGYLGRPGLTAEKFIPNPFGLESTLEPGARLYRTGDLVRWRRRGELEFLGRQDHQVKVRGYRIELDEVSAALEEQEGVAESVVVVGQSGVGEPQLVAYLSPATVDLEELRSSLLGRLPEFMVPAHFMLLEALPRTPNGKVDRKALPELVVAGSGEAGAPPKTQVEKNLATLWAECLGVEASTLGLRDNFFALGGHSLLATRVVSRITRDLGVDLGVRDLFEAPTLESLGRRVEALSEGSPFSRRPSIEAVAQRQDLPLSFAQERLWFLDRFEPGKATYNIPATVRMKGSLAVEALERSLAEIVVRHEVLRTTFQERDGAPVQVVAPPLRRYPLPTVDLRGLAEAEREELARHLALQEARRSFQLESGPLVRQVLLSLQEDEHHLLFTLHHIVSDGWSVGILVAELSELYEALSSGRAPSLEPLAVQYADYSFWQRQWVTDEALDRELQYWRERLSGFEERLDLPTDRPRPLVSSYRGEMAANRLEEGPSAALRRLGEDQEASLFMVLLAGLQAYLSRLTGQEDLAVGSPVANRSQPEVEGLIGLFVNTLVLRGDLSGDPTFLELLTQAKESTLGALGHQELPFEQVVEAVQPERDLGREPLFQVMLILEEASKGAPVLPGLQVTVLGADTGTAKFEQTWLAGDEEEGISLSLNYRPELLDPTTARRMVSQLRRLLRAVAEEPERNLSSLSLLDRSEEQQLLREWPASCDLSVGEESLAGVFREQARRTPEAPALVWPDGTWTFAELDRRSDHLAASLLQRGIQVGDRVALALERGPRLIQALMAVLKAGAAYVALDPEHPEERRRFLLEDSGAVLLLVDGEAIAGGPCPELSVEGDLEEGPLPVSWPRLGASDLAYVVYTSGSTGRPKGVLVEHGSALALSAALRATVYKGVSEPLRVSLNAPLVFDASVQQWLQLLEGHALALLDQEARADPHRLIDLVESLRIDLLDCTPSQLTVLVEAGLLEGQRPLRILVGGEAVPPALWQSLADASRVTAFNVYGPTECTVDVTAERVVAGTMWLLADLFPVIASTF